MAPSFGLFDVLRCTTTQFHVFCLFSLEPWWWSTDATSFTRSTPDDALMDCRFHAVIHFQVKLGKLILLVGRRLLDISQRGSIDNIADNEPLDGLVLGDGLSSRDTTDTFDMSASVLITSVIASLYSHLALKQSSVETQ